MVRTYGGPTSCATSAGRTARGTSHPTRPPGAFVPTNVEPHSWRYSMGVLKREPLSRQWWRRAECRGHDPELFSFGEEGEQEHEETARYICAELCPVREQCVRWALRETPPNFGVMRGGIIFDGKKRHLCERCRIAVVNDDQPAWECVVCERYDPCLGGCGRMVKKDADSWFCIECKADEEDLI